MCVCIGICVLTHVCVCIVHNPQVIRCVCRLILYIWRQCLVTTVATFALFFYNFDHRAWVLPLPPLALSYQQAMCDYVRELILFFFCIFLLSHQRNLPCVTIVCTCEFCFFSSSYLLMLAVIGDAYMWNCNTVSFACNLFNHMFVVFAFLLGQLA